MSKKQPLKRVMVWGRVDIPLIITCLQCKTEMSVIENTQMIKCPQCGFTITIKTDTGPRIPPLNLPPFRPRMAS